VNEHSDANEQLELFGDQQPLIALPPCGRGRGRCEAYVELGQHGEQYHCVICDGVAPVQFLRRQDCRRTSSGITQRRVYD
jgi:hypothetical protein